MRSAFGVEHGEEVAKFGMAPVKTAFNAMKGGFKNKNTVPQMPGKKSANVAAWNTGAHLGKNKNAYTAGGVAGATGLTGGVFMGQRRS